jgi:hypothetical protein
MRVLMRLPTVIAILCVTLAERASAQPLRVTATTPLTFGTVSPQLSSVVTPASPSAAVFSVQGPGSTTIQVLVVTPDQLLGSAQWVRTSSWTYTVTTQAGTTSAAPLVAGSELTVALGTDGLASVRVGATVTPPITVGSGSFSGPLTVVARATTAGLMSLTAQSAVTATIRQPLILTTVPMSFGSVYVSTPKTLAPTDASAFRMLIDGALGATIDVTLESVPTTLARDGGGGALSIGTWRAQTGGANCTSAAVTPTIGAAISLDLLAPVGSSGRTSYCLGGTVSPTALQPSGVYNGVVVLSIRYTGA